MLSKASRVSDKIYLCDILESNRAEVERFRADDDGAHSFPRYFDFVAALEGTKEDLQLRTRNAIKVAEHRNLISLNFHWNSLERELDFTPDMEVFSTLFERCHTEKRKRTLKQHVKYINFRRKIQLDHPVC